MEKSKSRGTKITAKTKKTAKATLKTTELSAEIIRQRAHEIYLAQGQAGNEVAHWLQAEQELKEQHK